ncbi:MAG: hypothetical protein IJZ32_01895 [Clostridia bacterium]|nr:hypothetical protein [Clostridia bacterium]
MEKKNVIIFGDSYSTFKGHIPDYYDTYYPCLDVCSVEETWWKSFVSKCNYHLIQNNSWSGSTIGYTGYNHADCSTSSSFIFRYKQLKEQGVFEKDRVDVILVFGGTNDSWANAELGNIKFSDWTEEDFFKVLPSICYFAYMLKTDFPYAKIIFIINTDIKEEIQNAIEYAAQYYSLQSVRLQDIDKQKDHPTKKGMKEICDQLLKVV